MSIELKDKLYTSTQVAEILGVSLRTLYRYMEDRRIGSMRTASGRHRFTKDQILDFLNAGNVEMPATSNVTVESKKDVSVQESVMSPVIEPFANVSAPKSTASPISSASQSVDDISFNDEIEKPPVVNVSSFSEENDAKPETFNDPFDVDNDPIVAENPVKPNPFGTKSEFNTFSEVEDKVESFKPAKPSLDDAFNPSTGVRDFTTKEDVQKPIAKEPVNEETLDPRSDLNIRYYKSEHSDLIRLAKKIHEIASAKDLEYAFSGHAGLSLHFLIKKTFTLLHFYANPEDMQIWREELVLIPVSNREEANIGVIVNTDIVFVPTKEMSGFKVVEDKVLLKDLSDRQELELARQFRLHLANASA